MRDDKPKVERRIWRAVLLGIIALPTVPGVQWTARRLPLLPLPKMPAVILSVVVAFALAGAALRFSVLALRELESRPSAPFAPAFIVFLGLLLLLGGMVFASVHDFLKPRSGLPGLTAWVAVTGSGIGVCLWKSKRARELLLSEPMRRFAVSLVWYLEAGLAVGLVLALAYPVDSPRVLAHLCMDGFISPFAAFLVSRWWARKPTMAPLVWRATIYAAALSVSLATWFLMPPL